MTERKKRERFAIRGIAAYPKTNRPYKWDNAANKSVPDPDGSFELTIKVDEDTKNGIETKLKAFAVENGLKKTVSLPIKPDLDEDDEETGLFKLKATQYGKDRDGKPNRIAHFDGSARPLPKDFFLTSGSEVIVSCYPMAYKAQGGGVSLKLAAVQVVKYVEVQGANPFGAVEGAWTANEEDGDNEDTTYDNSEDGSEETTDDPTDF